MATTATERLTETQRRFFWENISNLNIDKYPDKTLYGQSVGLRTEYLKFCDRVQTAEHGSALYEFAKKALKDGHTLYDKDGRHVVTIDDMLSLTKAGAENIKIVTDLTPHLGVDSLISASVLITSTEIAKTFVKIVQKYDIKTFTDSEKNWSNPKQEEDFVCLLIGCAKEKLPVFKAVLQHPIKEIPEQILSNVLLRCNSAKKATTLLDKLAELQTGKAQADAANLKATTLKNEFGTAMETLEKTSKQKSSPKAQASVRKAIRGRSEGGDDDDFYLGG